MMTSLQIKTGIDGSAWEYRTTVAPRVLLAEDDQAMRAMMAHWLLSDGYTVLECASGDELVDQLLFLSPEELKGIDVIITDMRMPGTDGLEALESLWFLPLPPVILVTAYGDEELRARAHDYGVAAMLTKPFDHDDLMISMDWLRD